MPTNLKPSLTNREAYLLDAALYAWRNRMHDLGMIDTSQRLEIAKRHDAETVAFLFTAPTIEVR